MKRAIIIDDEMLIVQSIKKLIERNELDIIIVGEAFDGLQALEIIKSERPDFIIMDIRMPQMDGLDVMRVLKEQNIHLKVIVLSAFREFEYARQAIDYGANGYLVKPVDEVKLVEAIGAVVRALDEEAENDQLKQSVVHLEPMIRENLLRYLIVDYELYLDMNQTIGYRHHLNEEKCQLAIIRFKSQITVSRNEIGKILEGIQDNPCSLTSGIVFFNHNDELVVIYEQDEYLNRIDAALNKEFADEFIIGVSRANYALKQMVMAYREANMALEMRFYNDQVKRFEYVVEASWHYKFYNDSGRIEQFFEQVSRGMREEVLQYLLDTEKQLANSRNRRPEEVYQFYYEHVVALKKVIQHSNLLTDKDDNISKLIQVIRIEELKKYATLSLLGSAIYELTVQLFDLMDRNRMGADGRIIAKVLRYCEECYAQEITLESISEQVNMSKNYFSAFFKRKTGDNFWDYLTAVRMDKAKELLRTTEWSAGTIATKVGYKNQSHFGRVFRESTGITPNEFRQRVK
ncbi:response regulator [Paenibacillus terrigena]|uniref:response regulator transcription factor n=1 Tax=Paenibacillus terrigena TaxID=369333 RepID=UPI0028D0248D|nr:response regulator [Paenibacillus terrigena]